MAASYIPSPERRAPFAAGLGSGFGGGGDLLGMYMNAKLAGLNLQRAQSAVNTAALEEQIKGVEAQHAPGDATSNSQYYKGRADREAAMAGQEIGKLFHQPTEFRLGDAKKRADTEGVNAETQRKNAARSLLELEGYGQQFKNTVLGPLLQQQAEKRVELIGRQTDEAAARTEAINVGLAQKQGVDKFEKDLKTGILAKDQGVLPHLIATDPSNTVWQALAKSEPFKGPLYETFLSTGSKDLAQTIAEGQVKKFVSPTVKVGRGRVESNPQFTAAVTPLVNSLMQRLNEKQQADALKRAPVNPTVGTTYPPPTSAIGLPPGQPPATPPADPIAAGGAAPSATDPAAAPAVEPFDPSKTYGEGAVVRGAFGGKPVVVKRVSGKWVTVDGM